MAALHPLAGRQRRLVLLRAHIELTIRKQVAVSAPGLEVIDPLRRDYHHSSGDYRCLFRHKPDAPPMDPEEAPLPSEAYENPHPAKTLRAPTQDCSKGAALLLDAGLFLLIPSPHARQRGLACHLIVTPIFRHIIAIYNLWIGRCRLYPACSPVRISQPRARSRTSPARGH